MPRRVLQRGIRMQLCCSERIGLYCTALPPPQGRVVLARFAELVKEVKLVKPVRLVKLVKEVKLVNLVKVLCAAEWLFKRQRHKYLGHNYLDHNYTGHNLGHNYVCGEWLFKRQRLARAS